MEKRFEDFLKRTINALNSLSMNYVLIGGIIAIYYGRLRATMDIDVILDVNEAAIAQANKIAETFRKFNIVASGEDIYLALKEKSYFSIFDEKSPFRVDAKGVYLKLDEVALQNRKEIRLFDTNVWAESPEDLIIAKLIYGSPKDIEDAVSVFANLRSQLNLDYLKKRAVEENVFDLLKKMIFSLR